MRHISISDKLILVSMAIITGTIIIVASYSFYNAKEAILERTFNQLTSVRAVKSMLVEDFFNNRINEVKLVKSCSDIQKLTQSINHFDSSKTFLAIEDSSLKISGLLIKNISKDYYNRILIIGKNHRILNLKANKNLSSKEQIDYSLLWEQAVSSDSVFMDDLHTYQDSEQSYFSIFSRIQNKEKETIGLIVYELVIDPINSIMLEKGSSNGLGESGESYIVGSDLLMRSLSRFDNASVLKTRVATQAVELAFNDKPGTKIITDYRGIQVLSSYSRLNIQNHKWAILAEIDYTEATIPIYQIGYEIVFISIFIFVVVLLIVIILSRKITNPIIQLHKAATRIGKGSFDIKVDYKLHDEIGDLGLAFKNMAFQLETQNQELKAEKDKNLRSLINGQETERQRLSRELHDSLGQLLIGLKLKYENCRNQQNMTNNSFSDLSELFDKTIEETRRISNNLMPAALSEFGLVTAIRHICNTITSSTDINIIFKSEGKIEALSKDKQTYIFRITQEALTNIVKHSHAKNATIIISFSKQKIHLQIEDDGKGFDKTQINHLSSNGLNNIQNRILLLSGNLEIDSAINKGTKIKIEIPNL